MALTGTPGPELLAKITSEEVFRLYYGSKCSKSLMSLKRFTAAAEA
jgi:hypothetical protein